MAFDLSAYFERIALKDYVPTVDAEALATIQRAHRLAIPFENLDVILGRGIRVDGESVFAKLVTARRGGFCFEHNRLFHDALEEIGFAVRPILARVRLGEPGILPRTHVLSLVTIDGQDWIADPGFGGSYGPPMPLADGEEAQGPDGALFRIARDPVHEWVLTRRGPRATTDGRGDASEWQDQYSFSVAPVFAADLEMGAWFASTYPESRFTNLRIVSLPLPSGFVSLTGRAYRRSNKGELVEAEISDPRVYRMRLGMLFGLQFSPEDVAELGLF